MILFGVAAEVSIGELFIAGFGPGLLIGVALMLFVHLYCRYKGWGKTDGDGRLPVLAATWSAGWALLMPVIILGGIYGGVFTPTEAAVVASEHVLRIELSGAVLNGIYQDGNGFVTAFDNSLDDPVRVAISRGVLDGLRGLKAAAAFPNSWNGRLATVDAQTSVTRLSATVLEIRVPPLPGFRISTPEVVTVTIPGGALFGRQPVVAGSFELLADPGMATLSGSLLTANEERVVNMAESEIVVTLAGDEFEPTLATDSALAAELAP
jgi:hypothetical protein